MPGFLSHIFGAFPAATLISAAQASDFGSDIRELSHNDLVAVMAGDCGHERAWREFIHRFSNYVAAVVIQECDRLKYRRGRQNVQDLVQDVYIRLRENDCHALREFRGNHENAILKYLRVIATRIVLNDLAHNSAEKRTAPGGMTSLETTIGQSDENRPVELKDLLGTDSLEEELRGSDLVEEIERCLSLMMRRIRNAERDLLVFRYFLFSNFTPQEIAELPEFELSQKRIANIISECKDKIRTCLTERLRTQATGQ